MENNLLVNKIGNFYTYREYLDEENAGQWYENETKLQNNSLKSEMGVCAS